MPDTPTPGQVNYEAFMRAMFPGTPQHTALAWRWVETKDRAAWEAAAQAVLAQAGLLILDLDPDVQKERRDA